MGLASVSKTVVHFLDWCGRAWPIVGIATVGHVVFDSIRNQSKQALGSNLGVGTAPSVLC